MLAELGANRKQPILLGIALLGGILFFNGCTVHHKPKKTDLSSAKVAEEVKPSHPVTSREKKAKESEEIVTQERGVIAEESIALPKRIPVDLEFSESESLSLENVYFEFDSAGLSKSSRVILTNQVEKLKKLLEKSPEMMLLVEGHCDERGTNEYNLALGERRSAGVRDYLISLGLPSRVMYIKTWGEEKPIDENHNEEAWAKNRRVEFKLSGINN
ncbi:MAG: OmpA family protein [bacterium]